MKEQFNKWIAFLKKDKKQTGMVLGLAAVGLLLWGRLLLKQVPQTASAGEKPAWLVEVESEAKPHNDQRVEVRLTIPRVLGRDPFRLDAEKYKRTLSEETLVSEAKYEEVVTDEAKRMAVVNAAEELRLQSITQGEVPAAFINGRLIRIGSSINGFKLLSCDERSAVLEMHGVKVRLGM